MSDTIIEVSNLAKYFPVRRGWGLGKQTTTVRAVDGVSLRIDKGETYGLVGESGCGKTTIAKLLLLMETPTEGEIKFEGVPLGRLRGPARARYRRRVQAVFQDSNGSLNPRMPIWRTISEPAAIHLNLGASGLRRRVAELLEVVGLDPKAADRYPHQFSGGQRQRIALARALSVDPEVIILDEPVSALDVSVRAQILNLLRDVQERFKLTYLLIAHDLAIVEHMSDQVGVMYLGKLVETARAIDLFEQPQHPYTQALIAAIPQPDPTRRGEEAVIEGEVPSPLRPPSGCHFHTRCPFVMEECRSVAPFLTGTGELHQVACHLYKPS